MDAVRQPVAAMWRPVTPRLACPSVDRPSEYLAKGNDPGLFREIADRESRAKILMHREAGRGDYGPNRCSRPCAPALAAHRRGGKNPRRRHAARSRFASTAARSAILVRLPWRTQLCLAIQQAGCPCSGNRSMPCRLVHGPFTRFCFPKRRNSPALMPSSWRVIPAPVNDLDSLRLW